MGTATRPLRGTVQWSLRSVEKYIIFRTLQVHHGFSAEWKALVDRAALVAGPVPPLKRSARRRASTAPSNLITAEHCGDQLNPHRMLHYFHLIRPESAFGAIDYRPDGIKSI